MTFNVYPPKHNFFAQTLLCQTENLLISVPCYSLPCSISSSYIVRHPSWTFIFTSINLEQNKEHNLYYFVFSCQIARMYRYIWQLRFGKVLEIKKCDLLIASISSIRAAMQLSKSTFTVKILCVWVQWFE